MRPVRRRVIFLPLNTAYTVDELTYFIENSGATLVVCDAPAKPRSRRSQGPWRQMVETLNADGSGSLTEAARAKPASSRPSTGQGRPGSLSLHLRHDRPLERRDADAGEPAVERCETLADYWRFTGGCAAARPADLPHPRAVRGDQHHAAAGGSMIFLPKFDLDAMIEWLPRPPR
jgi:malonyl-CoA/methylmalonyl-CoA synthetase